MENEIKTEEEYVQVPKGTTVNKDKYERQVTRAEDAEKRIKELEEQIASLTSTSEADKATIEDFKKKVADDSAKYESDKKELEDQLAKKEKTNELLQAGCIDPESGLASLHDGMTIEQLKENKPHLFERKTYESSAAPCDPAKDDGTDALRKAFGL